MTGQDPQLLQQIISDLRFLRHDWHDSVDTNNLRRGSPILRRLLVENDLQKGWRLAGKARQPRISAPSLTSLLESIPQQRIRTAMAGGATCNGVTVYEMIELDCQIAGPEDPAWTALHQEREDETLLLDQFVASPCMVVFGETVSRRNVVSFVANRLGGAHFDSRRSKAKGKKQHEPLLFRAIDRAMEIAGKPLIYFEFLSIGQCLVKSQDVAELMSSA